MKLKEFYKLSHHASDEDLEKFIKERFPNSIMKLGYIKDGIEYWNPEEVEEPGLIIIDLEVPHSDFVWSHQDSFGDVRYRNSYLNDILIMEVFSAISFVAKETSQFWFPDIEIKFDWDRGRKEDKEIIRFTFPQGYGS